MDDKAIKKKYESVFSSKPEKYYPVSALRELGCRRQQCSKCSRFFWSVENRSVCGDSACSGKYTFLEKRIATKEHDYVSTWTTFSKLLKKQGYTPVRRYPVSARWRNDIHFVEASIDNFIPHVITGKVEPPANPLTVPQLCLRFNDIENIGITGAHYSLFTMIGQHAFTPPKEYRQNDYLRHLLTWFFKGLGMKPRDIVFHEDVWVGSGNFGPCIELFSSGVELCNQVYMQFRQAGKSYKDLELKVLDMGLGHERNVWFSSKKSTSYEAVFPDVCSKLRRITGLKLDDGLWKKFVPYSGMLNLDEVQDVDKEWKRVSKLVDVETQELKGHVVPFSQIYSIADHSRALLVAISDGVLPSNVGGGHNLRVVLRRALDFIEKNSWDIKLSEVILWQAKTMKKIYPELVENVGDVQTVVDFEEERYKKTRKNMAGLLVKVGARDERTALRLYESHGISPELLKEKGFEISEEFYSKLTEGFRRKVQKSSKSEEEIDVQDTELLYRKNEYLREFKGTVLYSKNREKVFEVVLDRTAFYPTSGGQIYDLGVLKCKNNTLKVLSVEKRGGVVVHVVDGVLKEGETIQGIVDWDRRYQNMKHHTATHIINYAARKVLGAHIWQSGAEKTPEKGRLDITHFRALSREEVREIELVANSIVKKDLPVVKKVMKRIDAEKRFGFRLYQGGVVLGNSIRVIDIVGYDVEACGGTHCKSTSEVGRIRIIGTKKIQDGIVRITFVAGSALKKKDSLDEKLVRELGKLFKSGEINLESVCEVYSVEKKDVLKTVRRFIFEVENQNKEMVDLQKLTDRKAEKTDYKTPEELFSVWKRHKKTLDSLKKQYLEKLISGARNGDVLEAKISDPGFLMGVFRAARKDIVLIGDGVGISSLGMEEELSKRFKKVVRKGEMVLGFQKK